MCSVLAACTDPQAPEPSEPGVLPGVAPMVYPADNQPSAARIELGRRLFFDPTLSRDGSVSCASCHHPDKAFADDRAVSPGVEGRLGTRNVPSVINVGYQPYFLREGGVPTLEMQALVPIQEPHEFDMNILEVAERLSAQEVYRDLSQRAYQRSMDPYVITRALAAFQRTLVSTGSRYDRLVQSNDPTHLSAAELRGKQIFFSAEAGCADCHSGPLFTSFAFANNGLTPQSTDPGRKRLTGVATDNGLFKIPSLRNVAVTAPYMHDGSVSNLQEVVAGYVRGGFDHPNKDPRIRPLGLSAAQQEDLVAFLSTLTDREFETR